MTEPTHIEADSASETAHVLPTGEPCGESGAATAPFCRCGAGAHPEHQDRCANGHVQRSNTLSLLTGERSSAFWRAHAATQDEIRRAVLADRGHNDDDAPRALHLAAEGIAQAVLVRDSAFARMVEAGGPLSSSGRERRAFNVWTAALDRIERHLRLVGIERKDPKRVDTLASYVATTYGGAK